MLEIIDPVFAKTSQNARFLLSENERFGLVFVKTGSINSGTVDIWNSQLHCNENLIYVFPEKELRGLSPNFHIYVSVIDLYMPRIAPHIVLQQHRQTDRGNI